MTPHPPLPAFSPLSLPVFLLCFSSFLFPSSVACVFVSPPVLVPPPPFRPTPLVRLSSPPCPPISLPSPRLTHFSPHVSSSHAPVVWCGPKCVRSRAVASFRCARLPRRYSVPRQCRLAKGCVGMGKRSSSCSACCRADFQTALEDPLAHELEVAAPVLPPSFLSGGDERTAPAATHGGARR